MSAPRNSTDRLERLARLHPKAIDLSLDRVRRLLARLEDPQDRLPPVVHVAGTNGKGSVIAFMRTALEAAGYRVHVHVSPHLVRFNERIVLDSRPIEEDALAELLEECERLNEGKPITFFEITTAAALLQFSRVPADVVLLETGLGGRLDATNVVARPLLTAITPISIDHRQFLGDTLAEIAAEKAGILKPGVPCVLATQAPAAAAAVARRAAVVGTPLVVEDRDWSTQRLGDGLVYRAGDTVLSLPLPALAGDHQVQNAGLAVACLERLSDFQVPAAAIALGLETVEWPARLQRLRRGLFAERLPNGWDLWLDGGHNEGAARALARELARWRDAERHLGRHLVVGMLNSKDPAAFLAPLAPFVESVVTVAIPGEANSLGADALAAVAAGLGLSAKAAAGVAEALDALADAHRRPARVLICGSLYLAGTVLVENG